MYADNIDLYQVYCIFLCFNIINSLNNNLCFQPV